MSKHEFHPELAARARWLPRGVARPWTVPVLARLTGWSASRMSGGREIELDGCSVFVYRPSKEVDPPRPALLWIHGGGLLFGDARLDGPFIQRVADELGVIVASAQYRCAPSHPFPTPLHDCAQAFDWLAAQPDVDTSRLAVAGASAGGGLAAALCQLLRARGGLQPCFQLLVYPMLDDRSAEGADPRDAGLRIWDRRSNAMGWSAYLRGHERDAPPPFAVPGRCEDLSGLPPAWIGVGTLDLFHDEDLAYARSLEAAGVSVQLEVVPGAYHGFDLVDAGQPVARRFTDAQIEALAKHLYAD